MTMTGGARDWTVPPAIAVTPTSAATAAAPVKWRRLVDPDEPWIWLAYLPLYFFPWIKAPFDTFDVIASAVAIAILLVVYIGGARTSGRWLIGCATVICAVSLLLAPLGGNWTIFTIYAAAMVGRLRPPRHALLIIGGFCSAASAVGMMLAGPWTWWVPGILLAAMIGGANVSRTTLGDKNVELVAAQEEVRLLSRVAERERITRDLHDLLGRTLTLIAVKADLAERLLAVDAAGTRREIHEIAGAARESLSDVRKALSGMANTSLTRELQASRDVLAAADITCIVEGDADDVPSEEGAVLAMALREAVTNVVRHAFASTCRIVIERVPGLIRLRIIDDGRGGSLREGSGLTGMRLRLTAAGGGLAVEPAVCGTSLAVSVPASMS